MGPVIRKRHLAPVVMQQAYLFCCEPECGCDIAARALADILKYIVKPTGPFFPGFTISGALSGIIYGMVLYKKPITIKRIALANGLVMIFVNTILNTLWLKLLYGNAFFAILPARFLKQIVMFPIYVALFYTVSKMLSKADFFTFVRGQRA